MLSRTWYGPHPLRAVCGMVAEITSVALLFSVVFLLSKSVAILSSGSDLLPTTESMVPHTTGKNREFTNISPGWEKVRNFV